MCSDCLAVAYKWDMHAYSLPLQCSQELLVLILLLPLLLGFTAALFPPHLVLYLHVTTESDITLQESNFTQPSWVSCLFVPYWVLQWHVQQQLSQSRRGTAEGQAGMCSAKRISVRDTVMYDTDSFKGGSYCFMRRFVVCRAWILTSYALLCVACCYLMVELVEP